MASTEKELTDHLERLRSDISSLTETVSQLVSDTAGIKSTLKRVMGDEPADPAAPPV